jgi:hypothetical protein
MLKITHISLLSNFMIRCVFNTGEERMFDLKKALSIEDPFVKKILRPEVFEKVKIGEFGQLYWQNIGEIRELNDTVSPCDYDISPEFVYAHSKVAHR